MSSKFENICFGVLLQNIQNYTNIQKNRLEEDIICLSYSIPIVPLDCLGTIFPIHRIKPAHKVSVSITVVLSSFRTHSNVHCLL